MGPELMSFLGFPGKTFGNIDKRLSVSLQDHNRGKINEEDFWTLYREIIGKDLPPHDESLFGKFFKPKPDEPTVKIVRALKEAGIRVVVGSNTIDSHYEILERMGIFDDFDKVYASQIMGLAKPDPAFYEYILREEGVNAPEAFFTDDLEENIDSAVKAGLKAFLYTDAEALKMQLSALGLLAA